MIITPVTADFLHGAAHVETTARGVRPHRLPEWVRARFPDPQLLMVEGQPSGVRLVLSTAARSVALVCHPSRVGYVGLERPRGRVDLVLDGAVVRSVELSGGDLVSVDLGTGESSFSGGPSFTAVFDELPGGDKVIEIWLPHNESVELTSLRTDAAVFPGSVSGRRWVHHGSSISHGSNAAAPTGVWPAVAARLGGVDLRNLGFGGSALVDPFMARVMRDAPADLISVKLGINVVNSDVMRLRAFVPAVHGFLDTIRDGHPETPLVLISPIFCGIHEDTPGPGAFDPVALASGRVGFIATGSAGPGRLTLRVIREALASVVSDRGDANLHYCDGTLLYGERDAADSPLPDALHPGPESHRAIGERFAEYAFGTGGPFADPAKSAVS